MTEGEKKKTLEKWTPGKGMPKKKGERGKGGVSS